MCFDIERLITEGIYAEPTFVIPTGTRREDVPGWQMIEKPGFLNCTLLIKGWTFAYDSVAKECWTEHDARKYLAAVLCINEEGLRRFSQCLHVGKCVHNPLWDVFDLEVAFETIMHNCMNVGKAMRDCLFDWGATAKLKTKILHELEKPLKILQESRTEDFKMRTVNTENFFGWVGEEYRTFNLLSPWILRFLKTDNFQPKTPGEEPPNDLPSEDWTTDNLRYFLHSKKVRKVDVRESYKGGKLLQN